MPWGWVFSTMFLPQVSGFRTFFVPGEWGIRPFKKFPGVCPGGWSGLELTDTLFIHGEASGKACFSRRHVEPIYKLIRIKVKYQRSKMYSSLRVHPKKNHVNPKRKTQMKTIEHHRPTRPNIKSGPQDTRVKVEELVAQSPTI